MATLLDSFLVTLDSKADTSGFDIFGAASRRLVITLGDVMNIVSKLTGSIANIFNNVVKADVINAKIDGLATSVGESSQYIRKQVYDMSQSLGTDFASAIDNYAKLKQYGIDPLKGALKDLKGIGMVYGSDMNRLILAYGQIAAMGTLQGQEKNQLINAGIPIWQMLTRTTGKSVGELQDMMRNKEITFDMVTKAFEDENKRLQPSIQKLSHSVSAQLTKMRNWWFNTQQTVANTRLWERASKFMEGWVNRFIGYFTDTRVLNGLNQFGDYILAIIQNIEDMYHAVSSNLPAMTAIIGASIAYIVKAWGGAMVAMARSGLWLLINPVTWLVIALGLLLGALIDIDDAVNGKKSFINWGEGVKTAYKWFRDFTIGVAEWLGDTEGWKAMGNTIAKIFDQVVAAFTSFIGKVQALINQIKPPAWVKSLMDYFGLSPNENVSQGSNIQPDIPTGNDPWADQRAGQAAAAQQRERGTFSSLMMHPWRIPGDAYDYANNTLNSWMLPFVMRGRASQEATKQAAPATTTNNVTVTSTINTPADPNAIAGAVTTEVVNGVKSATGANATVQANNAGAVKQ